MTRSRPCCKMILLTEVAPLVKESTKEKPLSSWHYPGAFLMRLTYFYLNCIASRCFPKFFLNSLLVPKNASSDFEMQ